MPGAATTLVSAVSEDPTGTRGGEGSTSTAARGAATGFPSRLVDIMARHFSAYLTTPSHKHREDAPRSPAPQTMERGSFAGLGGGGVAPAGVAAGAAAGPGMPHGLSSVSLGSLTSSSFDIPLSSLAVRNSSGIVMFPSMFANYRRFVLRQAADAAAAASLALNGAATSAGSLRKSAYNGALGISGSSSGQVGTEDEDDLFEQFPMPTRLERGLYEVTSLVEASTRSSTVTSTPSPALTESGWVSGAGGGGRRLAHRSRQGGVGTHPQQQAATMSANSATPATDTLIHKAGGNAVDTAAASGSGVVLDAAVLHGVLHRALRELLEMEDFEAVVWVVRTVYSWNVCEPNARATLFFNTLRDCLPSESFELVELVLDTWKLIVDDLEPNNAIVHDASAELLRSSLEWLFLDAQSDRRLSALLVLQHLVAQGPRCASLVTLHLSELLVGIWNPLKDPQLHIRELAATTLEQLLEMALDRQDSSSTGAAGSNSLFHTAADGGYQAAAHGGTSPQQVTPPPNDVDVLIKKACRLLGGGYVGAGQGVSPVSVAQSHPQRSLLGPTSSAAFDDRMSVASGGALSEASDANSLSSAAHASDSDVAVHAATIAIGAVICANLRLRQRRQLSAIALEGSGGGVAVAADEDCLASLLDAPAVDPVALTAAVAPEGFMNHSNSDLGDAESFALRSFDGPIVEHALSASPPPGYDASGASSRLLSPYRCGGQLSPPTLGGSPNAVDDNRFAAPPLQSLPANQNMSARAAVSGSPPPLHYFPRGGVASTTFTLESNGTLHDRFILHPNDFSMITGLAINPRKLHVRLYSERLLPLLAAQDPSAFLPHASRALLILTTHATFLSEVQDKGPMFSPERLQYERSAALINIGLLYAALGTQLASTVDFDIAFAKSVHPILQAYLQPHTAAGAAVSKIRNDAAAVTLALIVETLSEQQRHDHIGLIRGLLDMSLSSCLTVEVAAAAAHVYHCCPSLRAASQGGILRMITESLASTTCGAGHTAAPAAAAVGGYTPPSTQSSAMFPAVVPTGNEIGFPHATDSAWREAFSADMADRRQVQAKLISFHVLQRIHPMRWWRGAAATYFARVCAPYLHHPHVHVRRECIRCAVPLLLLDCERETDMFDEDYDDLTNDASGIVGLSEDSKWQCERHDVSVVTAQPTKPGRGAMMEEGASTIEHHGRFHQATMRHVVMQLVHVAVADPVAELRFAALRSLRPEVDTYLACNDECLDSLFDAVNDELLDNRLEAIGIIARLVQQNPSVTYPKLRNAFAATLSDAIADTNQFDMAERLEVLLELSKVIPSETLSLSLELLLDMLQRQLFRLDSTVEVCTVALRLIEYLLQDTHEEDWPLFFALFSVVSRHITDIQHEENMLQAMSTLQALIKLMSNLPAGSPRGVQDHELQETVVRLQQLLMQRRAPLSSAASIAAMKLLGALTAIEPLQPEPFVTPVSGIGVIDSRLNRALPTAANVAVSPFAHPPVSASGGLMFVGGGSGVHDAPYVICDGPRGWPFEVLQYLLRTLSGSMIPLNEEDQCLTISVILTIFHKTPIVAEHFHAFLGPFFAIVEERLSVASSSLSLRRAVFNAIAQLLESDVSYLSAYGYSSAIVRLVRQHWDPDQPSVLYRLCDCILALNQMHSAEQPLQEHITWFVSALLSALIDGKHRTLEVKLQIIKTLGSFQGASLSSTLMIIIPQMCQLLMQPMLHPDIRLQLMRVLTRLIFVCDVDSYISRIVECCTKQLRESRREFAAKVAEVKALQTAAEASKDSKRRQSLVDEARRVVDEVSNHVLKGVPSSLLPQIVVTCRHDSVHPTADVKVFPMEQCTGCAEVERAAASIPPGKLTASIATGGGRQQTAIVVPGRPPALAARNSMAQTGAPNGSLFSSTTIGGSSSTDSATVLQLRSTGAWCSEGCVRLPAGQGPFHTSWLHPWEAELVACVCAAAGRCRSFEDHHVPMADELALRFGSRSSVVRFFNSCSNPASTVELRRTELHSHTAVLPLIGLENTAGSSHLGATSTTPAATYPNSAMQYLLPTDSASPTRRSSSNLMRSFAAVRTPGAQQQQPHSNVAIQLVPLRMVPSDNDLCTPQTADDDTPFRTPLTSGPLNPNAMKSKTLTHPPASSSVRTANEVDTASPDPVSHNTAAKSHGKSTYGAALSVQQLQFLKQLPASQPRPVFASRHHSSLDSLERSTPYASPLGATPVGGLRSLLTSPSKQTTQGSSTAASGAQHLLPPQAPALRLTQPAEPIGSASAQRDKHMQATTTAANQQREQHRVVGDTQALFEQHCKNKAADWKSWFEQLTVTLIGQCRAAYITSCVELARRHYTIACALFPWAFLSHLEGCTAQEAEDWLAHLEAFERKHRTPVVSQHSGTASSGKPFSAGGGPAVSPHPVPIEIQNELCKLVHLIRRDAAALFPANPSVAEKFLPNEVVVRLAQRALHIPIAILYMEQEIMWHERWEHVPTLAALYDNANMPEDSRSFRFNPKVASYVRRVGHSSVKAPLWEVLGDIYKAQEVFTLSSAIAACHDRDRISSLVLPPATMTLGGGLSQQPSRGTMALPPSPFLNRSHHLSGRPSQVTRAPIAPSNAERVTDSSNAFPALVDTSSGECLREDQPAAVANTSCTLASNSTSLSAPSPQLPGMTMHSTPPGFCPAAAHRVGNTVSLNDVASPMMRSHLPIPPVADVGSLVYALKCFNAIYDYQSVVDVYGHLRLTQSPLLLGGGGPRSRATSPLLGNRRRVHSASADACLPVDVARQVAQAAHAMGDWDLVHDVCVACQLPQLVQPRVFSGASSRRASLSVHHHNHRSGSLGRHGSVSSCDGGQAAAPGSGVAQVPLSKELLLLYAASDIARGRFESAGQTLQKLREVLIDAASVFHVENSKRKLELNLMFCNMSDMEEAMNICVSARNAPLPAASGAGRGEHGSPPSLHGVNSASITGPVVSDAFTAAAESRLAYIGARPLPALSNPQQRMQALQFRSTLIPHSRQLRNLLCVCEQLNAEGNVSRSISLLDDWLHASPLTSSPGAALGTWERRILTIEQIKNGLVWAGVTSSRLEELSHVVVQELDVTQKCITETLAETNNINTQGAADTEDFGGLLSPKRRKMFADDPFLRRQASAAVAGQQRQIIVSDLETLEYHAELLMANLEIKRRLLGHHVYPAVRRGQRPVLSPTYFWMRGEAEEAERSVAAHSTDERDISTYLALFDDAQSAMALINGVSEGNFATSWKEFSLMYFDIQKTMRAEWIDAPSDISMLNNYRKAAQETVIALQKAVVFASRVSADAGQYFNFRSTPNATAMTVSSDTLTTAGTKEPQGSPSPSFSPTTSSPLHTAPTSSSVSAGGTQAAGINASAPPASTTATGGSFGVNTCGVGLNPFSSRRRLMSSRSSIAVSDLLLKALNVALNANTFDQLNFSPDMIPNWALVGPFLAHVATRSKSVEQGIVQMCQQSLSLMSQLAFYMIAAYDDVGVRTIPAKNSVNGEGGHRSQPATTPDTHAPGEGRKGAAAKQHNKMKRTSSNHSVEQLEVATASTNVPSPNKLPAALSDAPRQHSEFAAPLRLSALLAANVPMDVWWNAQASEADSSDFHKLQTGSGVPSHTSPSGHTAAASALLMDTSLTSMELLRPVRQVNGSDPRRKDATSASGSQGDPRKAEGSDIPDAKLKTIQAEFDALFAADGAAPHAPSQVDDSGATNTTGRVAFRQSTVSVPRDGTSPAASMAPHLFSSAGSATGSALLHPHAGVAQHGVSAQHQAAAPKHHEVLLALAHCSPQHRTILHAALQFARWTAVTEERSISFDQTSSTGGSTTLRRSAAWVEGIRGCPLPLPSWHIRTQFNKTIASRVTVVGARRFAVPQPAAPFVSEDVLWLLLSDGLLLKFHQGLVGSAQGGPHGGDCDSLQTSAAGPRHWDPQSGAHKHQSHHPSSLQNNELMQREYETPFCTCWDAYRNNFVTYHNEARAQLTAIDGVGGAPTRGADYSPANISPPIRPHSPSGRAVGGGPPSRSAHPLASLHSSSSVGNSASCAASLLVHRLMPPLALMEVSLTYVIDQLPLLHARRSLVLPVSPINVLTQLVTQQQTSTASPTSSTAAPRIPSVESFGGTAAEFNALQQGALRYIPLRHVVVPSMFHLMAAMEVQRQGDDSAHKWSSGEATHDALLQQEHPHHNLRSGHHAPQHHQHHQHFSSRLIASGRRRKGTKGRHRHDAKEEDVFAVDAAVASHHRYAAHVKEHNTKVRLADAFDQPAAVHCRTGSLESGLPGEDVCDKNGAVLVSAGLDGVRKMFDDDWLLPTDELHSPRTHARRPTAAMSTEQHQDPSVKRGAADDSALEQDAAEDAATQRRVSILRRNRERNIGDLHRMLLLESTDPTKWLESRAAYARQLAEWGVVHYLFDISCRCAAFTVVDLTTGHISQLALGAHALRASMHSLQRAADGASTLATRDPCVFRLTAAMRHALPLQSPFSGFVWHAAEALQHVYSVRKELAGVVEYGLESMRMPSAGAAALWRQELQQQAAIDVRSLRSASPQSTYAGDGASFRVTSPSAIAAMSVRAGSVAGQQLFYAPPPAMEMLGVNLTPPIGEPHVLSDESAAGVLMPITSECVSAAIGVGDVNDLHVQRHRSFTIDLGSAEATRRSSTLTAGGVAPPTVVSFTDLLELGMLSLDGGRDSADTGEGLHQQPSRCSNAANENSFLHFEPINTGCSPHYVPELTLPESSVTQTSGNPTLHRTQHAAAGGHPSTAMSYRSSKSRGSDAAEFSLPPPLLEADEDGPEEVCFNAQSIMTRINETLSVYSWRTTTSGFSTAARSHLQPGGFGEPPERHSSYQSVAAALTSDRTTTTTAQTSTDSCDFMQEFVGSFRAEAALRIQRTGRRYLCFRRAACVVLDATRKTTSCMDDEARQKLVARLDAFCALPLLQSRKRRGSEPAHATSADRSPPFTFSARLGSATHIEDISKMVAPSSARLSASSAQPTGSQAKQQHTTTPPPTGSARPRIPGVDYPAAHTFHERVLTLVEAAMLDDNLVGRNWAECPHPWQTWAPHW